MSDASLVVRASSLSDMETAMTTAHDAVSNQIAGLLSSVNTEIAGWSPDTTSRPAEMDYQRRLRDGVERQTTALDQVRAALAETRESAYDTEVENVALIGGALRPQPSGKLEQAGRDRQQRHRQHHTRRLDDIADTRPPQRPPAPAQGHPRDQQEGTHSHSGDGHPPRRTTHHAADQ